MAQDLGDSGYWDASPEYVALLQSDTLKDSRFEHGRHQACPARLGADYEAALPHRELDEHISPPLDDLSRGTTLASRTLIAFTGWGFALFATDSMLHPGHDSGDQSHRIELTQGDLRQMSVSLLAQGRPAPTAEEIASLVRSKIDEEILFREALAMGLDKDDAIIKRRLAQKMDFVIEDLATMLEPTTAQLTAWFKQNEQRFMLPPRASSPPPLLLSRPAR